MLYQYFLVSVGYFTVADGVDRTQCCASKGMSGGCLGACSGNSSRLAAVNLIDCAPHLYSVASCYDIPQPATPSGPRECSCCC